MRYYLVAFYKSVALKAALFKYEIDNNSGELHFIKMEDTFIFRDLVGDVTGSNIISPDRYQFLGAHDN